MTTTPKTIGLCIFLFLASALITLSLKSTPHHRPQWPLSPHHHQTSSTTSQPPTHPPTHPVAFATFLVGNTNPQKKPTDAESAAIDDADDGYFLSARVLAYQLLHSRTAGTNHSIPFLVVCTQDLSQRKRDRLRRDGATVVVVEKLEADWVRVGDPRWVDVLTKLRLWQLTEYSKILFIDADHLVTGRLDGVFWDEATLTQGTAADPAATRDDEAALPRTYMFATHADYFGYDHPYPPPADLTYLNAGFFCFTPSLALFDYYLSLLRLPGRFDPGFPEQNLLNYAHRQDGNMPWKPLYHGWNVNWPTARDWRGGARSFHAKYWDGDPSHDPVLKAIWKEQRAEMEGFYRGVDVGAAHGLR
jgi:alpha-N-acetylglucosamine transferase